MWLTLLYLALILIDLNNALILNGEISTTKDWTFIARFCYLSRAGVIAYSFEYPNSFCCQNAILYYDTQWNDVYPQPDMSCNKKKSLADTGRNQILSLSSNTISCSLTKNNTVIFCKGNRTFSSMRPRWWFLVISNCGFVKGIMLKYNLVLTNGDSFWTKHFSADEQNILECDIFFAVIQMVLLVASIYVAYMLAVDQLFHITYKLYLWALLFEVFSIFTNIVYYVDYGETGKPRKGIKNIGRGCHYVSDVIFVVLLILLGKGWTVTRARISPGGQVKLAVFCSLYGIAYLALFIYEAKAFDPGKVLYIYESPAGVGICIMKVIAWCWFIYGIFFTLKNYATKRLFYYPFMIFYTAWFLSGPILVLIATEVIPEHRREQVMNGVDRAVAFLAFGFFLMLMRPSAANKNFPFHVRTTQIGFIDTTNNGDFPNGLSYTPGNESIRLNPNITSLFAAESKTRSDSTTPVLSSQTFNNNSNLYNNPEPSAPPHRYSQVVQNKFNSGYSNGNFVNIQGNFVNNQGDLMNDQGNTNRNHGDFNTHTNMGKKESSILETNGIPPLLRTEEQISSLFKANGDAASPLYDAIREPSPSFFIPEPSLDALSPLPPVSKGENTLLPAMKNFATAHDFPTSSQPQQSSKFQSSSSLDQYASQKSQTDEHAGTFPNAEKISDTHTEAEHTHDHVGKSESNAEKNKESKRKKSRKKSRKDSTLNNGSEVNSLSKLTPNNLEPIKGLNREKLPPLRGALPRLNEANSQTIDQ